ncbi:MAG: hypothetical protein K9K63_14900 [Desulfotignum sp.]|nr:hypothetical protein [Desulfotignum sp.]MCF8138590.1 hypothetical protein [Desulfotignum sp.]
MMSPRLAPPVLIPGPETIEYHVAPLWNPYPLCHESTDKTPCHIAAMAQLLISNFSESIRFRLTRQLQRVIAQCF